MSGESECEGDITSSRSPPPLTPAVRIFAGVLERRVQRSRAPVPYATSESGLGGGGCGGKDSSCGRSSSIFLLAPPNDEEVI